MEFIAAFVPPMVPALVLAFRTHFHARKLSHLVHARYPEILERAFSRMRWYDRLLGGKDLHWKPFRDQVVSIAQSYAASDPELATVLARLEQAQRWENRALIAGLVGVVVTYLILRMTLSD
jgi:hypothetical protein